jgi:hypothetical protein
MGTGPSRGLSDDDLGLVRTGYEAFNRQDVDALLELGARGRAVSVAFHDVDNPLRLLDEGGGA